MRLVSRPTPRASVHVIGEISDRASKVLKSTALVGLEGLTRSDPEKEGSKLTFYIQA